MIPGIHLNIPNKDYHAGAGVSKSGLWQIHKFSPAHYAYAPPEERNHFDIGEAGHIAVLEPDTFEARVHCGPEDRRGKKWLAAKDECDAAGWLLLTSGDYDKALKIRDTIHADTTLNHLITRGDRMIEASGYWTDPQTGMLCRCRPDLWRRDLRLQIDLKTTVSARQEDFARSVVNYGYHAQEAFYTDGWSQTGNQVDAFLFVAVEKKDPFCFSLYELPPSIVDEGRAIMRKSLGRYAECVATQTWPGYATGVQELTFPRWSYTEIEAPEMETQQ
ncbi:exonuclease [Paracoccus phage vB_PmaP_KLEP18-1]|nr:exonuclease [Paracoccus phage vB_PmaP_KLEP18-1]